MDKDLLHTYTDFISIFRDEPIDAVIIQGIISMSPLVQQLPEDRSIHMRVDKGLCSIVVWTHRLLGMTVEVRQPSIRNRTSSGIQFGTGNPTVIIEYGRGGTYSIRSDQSTSPIPSIALMNTVDDERLFTLEAEEDGKTIAGTYSSPASGYAVSVLSDVLPWGSGSAQVAISIAHAVCALALRMRQCLLVETYDDYGTGTDNESRYRGPPSARRPVAFKELAILAATRLLWGNSIPLDAAIVQRMYRSQGVETFTTDNMLPEDVFSQIQQWRLSGVVSDARTLYYTLNKTALYLTVTVCAFSSVTNIEDISALPLCRSIEVLDDSDLASRLSAWNGRDAIGTHCENFLLDIACLVRGHTVRDASADHALICENGWSVFLTTFMNSDPGSIGQYSPTYCHRKTGKQIRETFRY